MTEEFNSLGIPRPRIPLAPKPNTKRSSIPMSEQRSPLRITALKRNVENGKKIRLSIPKEDGELLSKTTFIELKNRRRSHDENYESNSTLDSYDLAKTLKRFQDQRPKSPIQVRSPRNRRNMYVESGDPIPEEPIYQFL